MKIKTVVSAFAAAGMIALASAPAHSAVALDNWQLDLNGAGIASLTTGIGHLNLAGGGATVNQQVDGLGNVFVGAKFNEFGGIFTVNYIPNNIVGSGDFGLPAGLNGAVNLEFAFTNLQGSVISGGGGGAFGYAFTPGVGNIELRQAGTLVHIANFTPSAGSNGSFNNNVGAVGSVGDSTLLSLVSTTGYTANTFRDSLGASLDPAVAAGQLFLNFVTHNTIASAPAGIVACVGANFVVGDSCVVVQVTSDGAADLLRQIPEPETLGLLGIGLLGLVAGLRRRKEKVVA